MRTAVETLSAPAAELPGSVGLGARLLRTCAAPVPARTATLPIRAGTGVADSRLLWALAALAERGAASEPCRGATLGVAEYWLGALPVSTLAAAAGGAPAARRWLSARLARALCTAMTRGRKRSTPRVATLRGSLAAEGSLSAAGVPAEPVSDGPSASNQYRPGLPARPHRFLAESPTCSSPRQPQQRRCSARSRRRRDC